MTMAWLWKLIRDIFRKRPEPPALLESDDRPLRPLRITLQFSFHPDGTVYRLRGPQAFRVGDSITVKQMVHSEVAHHLRKLRQSS